MIKIIKVGSDPEFFVRRGNIFFPPVGLTNGTKVAPELIDIRGYYLQRDNLCLEGNIPPANTRDEFIGNLITLKQLICDRIKPFKLNLVCADSAEFLPRFLHIPEAHEYGCQPYQLAWRNGANSVGDSGLFKERKRPAGFHIHIGYDVTTISKPRMNLIITKLFDMFVTSPARQYFLDSFRSKFYGMFGAYRTTPYGVECRSLGGFFLHDEYLGWVYDQVMKLEEYINSNNVATIEKLFDRYSSITYHWDFIKGYYIDSYLYDDLKINLKDQLIPSPKTSVTFNTVAYA